MKNIKNNLLLTTAVILCVQFSAPAFAQSFSNSQIPAAFMPRFYYAIDTGNFADVKAILDNTRSTLIADAANHNYKLDLEFRDENGNTPLIRAAAKGDADIVSYMVQLGADINSYNPKYETPLITAYNTGHFDIAKFLLARGAIDNYQIAQKIQAQDVQIAEAETAKKQAVSTKSSALKWGIGLGVVGGAAAGIAVAAGGGGGSSVASGGGSGGGGLDPVSLAPNSFVTAEAQNQEGIIHTNAQYAYARGYDGSIYSRNSDGTLVDNAVHGNVKVAVVDTGVDFGHPELAGQVLTGLSVTCGDSGCVSGGDAKYVAGASALDGQPLYNQEVEMANHGTMVAGIIAAKVDGVDINGNGMHGIAPGARIMSIGFYDPAYGVSPPGSLTHGDAPGIKYAIDNGAQVVNGSYGYGGTTIATMGTASLNSVLNNTYGGTTLKTEYQHGVANHAIFVYAAGNDSTVGTPVADPSAPAGIPYYFQGANPFTIGTADYNTYESLNPSVSGVRLDWSKNWLSVVSVKSDNSISDFSNRCGVAKNWCLAAPGEITQSTGYAIPAVGQQISSRGYYSDLQGTSFAAPNVSGAVAVLLGAFPQLTPERVVRILLNTATDLGAAGVDDIYGYGLVNLDRATSPTDSGWTLASVGASAPVSFYSSGFGLSSAFGNVLAKNNTSLIFLDGYGKDYTVPLTMVGKNLQDRKTTFDKFTQLGSSDFDNSIKLAESTNLSFSNAVDNGGIDKIHDQKLAKFSFQSAVPVGSENVNLAFNYKANLANMLSSSGYNEKPENLMASDAYKNPYLSIAGDNVSSSVVGYGFGNYSMRMASYVGDERADNYAYRFDNKKAVSGVFDEYTYSSNDKKSSLSLNGGVMIEKNGMLGSETSGAFAIDNSSTYHSGISGKYALAENVSLIANYNLGLTQVSASSDSIFTNFNNITTNSFAAGVEFANVKNDGDVFGFAASQPLRVASGSAGLTLPVDVASDGSVLYQNRNLNLSPSGREFDVESYYNVKFSRDAEFSLNGILRFNPNNDAQASNDATILGKYKLEF